MDKYISYLITFLIALTIVVGVYEANKEPEMYRDINLKIESINGQTTETQDKFKNVVYCNTIVFSYKDLHYIYNTCADGNYEYKPNIDGYWILKHKVGDIVHVKAIPKSYLK